MYLTMVVLTCCIRAWVNWNLSREWYDVGSMGDTKRIMVHGYMNHGKMAHGNTLHRLI